MKWLPILLSVAVLAYLALDDLSKRNAVSAWQAEAAADKQSAEQMQTEIQGLTVERDQLREEVARLSTELAPSPGAGQQGAQATGTAPSPGAQVLDQPQGSENHH